MSEEKRVVDRFADAQLGDWVWVHDRDMAVYDENRKYIGRGGYRLEQVTGRNRSSIVIDSYGRGGVKYDLTTGYQRGNKAGWALVIRGNADRVDDWWRSQAHKLAKLVETCRDLEKLKSVAFVMGFEERPPAVLATQQDSHATDKSADAE